MAATAFTSTFSAETLAEVIITSEALATQWVYIMQHTMDRSFFIEVDLKQKIKNKIKYQQE